MEQQMQTFSFNPAINLSGEGNWLLAITSFEATNSVFYITYENNSFSFSTPRNWSHAGNGEIIDQLNEILQLRSENDIELDVREVEKRSTQKQCKTVDII